MFERNDVNSEPVCDASETDEETRLERIRTCYRSTLKKGLIRIILTSLSIAIIFGSSFGVAVVSGNDMYPALRDGDTVIYYKRADYICNDAVLYRNSDEIVAGRIQATRGAEISMTGDGRITIDSNIQPVQSRVGIYSETLVHTDSRVEYPHTVADGTFYILGDNRESAHDSRDEGEVREEDLLGKIFTVIRRRGI